MSTILIKDSLRASVEAASGGSQTVLYTAKGQPTFMNIVKKFDLSEVLPGTTGPHPAFIINGVEKSQIFVGTYAGVVKNGELLSLPNQAPSIVSYNTGFAAAIANGSGHHLMTASEWAAIALRSWKNGTMPQGNGYYGRSSSDATQIGRRVDGLDATQGITTGDPRILNGSGPVSFRHNGKYNGISDLAGNTKDMLQGVRTVFGELQIIPNNNSATVVSALDESSLWRAIDARNGDLIQPDGTGTTQNSIKLTGDVNSTAAYTLIFSGTNIFNKQAAVSSPVSEAGLMVLKKLALWLPAENLQNMGACFVSQSSSETVLSRGGHFSEGSSANIYSQRLGDTRSVSANVLSVRPAYYTA